MNYSEIIEKLKDITSIGEFAYHDIPGKSTGRNSVFIEGIGECIEVQQHGGEDQGSEWWSVKFFPDHDVYIKVSGYYSSYNGTDFDGWEDCHQVRPREKVIIVYE